MMKSPMREEKKKEVEMKPKTNLGVLRETHLSARKKTKKLLEEKSGELTPEQRKVLESFMKTGG